MGGDSGQQGTPRGACRLFNGACWLFLDKQLSSSCVIGPYAGSSSAARARQRMGHRSGANRAAELAYLGGALIHPLKALQGSRVFRAG